MEPTQIVKKPLITEKSTWEADARNRYAFEIHPRANKIQVREAVQKLYGVRVTAVATQRRRGKHRRTRWGMVKTRDWKRAVVQLDENDRIDLF